MTITNALKKTCSLCKVVKPATSEFFHRQSGKKSGFRSQCIECCTGDRSGKRRDYYTRGPNHGESKTPLYRRWKAMNDRCHRPAAHNYKWYGGKGVYVCDAWRGRGGFLTFKEWAVSTGFAPELQLDRIDPEGPYSPDNCRWITARENVKRAGHSTSLIVRDSTLESEVAKAAWDINESVSDFVRIAILDRLAFLKKKASLAEGR